MAAVDGGNFLFTTLRYAPFTGPFVSCFREEVFDYLLAGEYYNHLGDLNLETERSEGVPALTGEERQNYQLEWMKVTGGFNRLPEDKFWERKDDVRAQIATDCIRSGRISTVLTVALLVGLAVGGIFTGPLAYGVATAYTLFGGLVWGLSPSYPTPKAGEFEALSAEISLRLGGNRA